MHPHSVGKPGRGRPKPLLARGWTLVPVILLVASGCDSIFGSSSRPDTVVIQPGTVTFDAIGETRTLEVTVRDRDARVMTDETVIWASSNPSVVEVSESGVATAVGNGTAQITATARSVTGSASASVSQVVAELVPVDGEGQTGVVGEVLERPIVVEARDRLGSSVAGVELRSVPVPGSGSVGTIAYTTGSDGRISVEWILGTRTDADHRLRVWVADDPGLEIEVLATAVAGPPTLVGVIAGDGQEGLPEQPLPLPVEVRISDQWGNAIPDVTVTFEVLTGGGSVAPAEVTSNVEGTASTQWTLGPTAGEQTLGASIPVGAQGTVTATAVAASAAPTAR